MHAHETPELLGKLWIEAIKSHSIEKLNPLIHPKCPKESIDPIILKRMVEGALPEKFKLETTDLGSKENLAKAYLVVPEKQLNLVFLTKSPEERKEFGIGKGFPIGKFKDKWFFTVCLKRG